jgi:tetratricopeptide (TPR) repeat protein
MSFPNVDQLLAHVQELLREACAETAIVQLTNLQSHQLSPAHQAHTQALLAQAYEFQSRWDEVAQLLRPYEDRTRSAALPVAVHQRICLRLSSLYTERGDLHRSINFARQALQLAKFADDPRIQGEGHQALGKVYRLLGQPVFTRQQYQAALNLHQALGARVLMAWSYYGLAIVAAGNGEYALAQQSLDRAFNLVSEADDPLLYGLLCSVQATTLALEEIAPLPERIEWFARAQAAFERIGHRRFVARTLGNIGHQLLWDGQCQKAQTTLRQALTLGQELQDRRSVASVLETLADLHTMQGQFELSQSYLAEALALVEEHDRFVELQVRLTLA